MTLPFASRPQRASRVAEQQFITGLLGADTHKQFQDRYRHDRAAFLTDCILYPRNPETGKPGSAKGYQLRAAAALDEYRRVIIHGPHGIGKTTLSSLMFWHGILTNDIVRVMTTAFVWSHLTDKLWPEIHLWHGRIRWEMVGLDVKHGQHLLEHSFKMGNRYAFSQSPKAAAAFEGTHADNMIMIADEAKAIPGKIFDAMEGSLTHDGEGGREAYALVPSTPPVSEEDGLGMRYHEMCINREKYAKWHVIHVTKEEAITEGMMTEAWADDMAIQWGIDSALYAAKVLGEFPTEAHTRGLIPASWRAGIVARWEEWKAAGFPNTALTAVAADVSDGGDESIVVGAWDSIKIGELKAVTLRDIPYEPGYKDEEYGHIAPEYNSTLAIVREMMAMADPYHQHHVWMIPDATGIGLGVKNRLLETKYKNAVIAFVYSYKAYGMDSTGTMRFRNWKDAGFWLMREMLDPANGIPVCLPDDDILWKQLTSIQYGEAPGGTLAIESKAKYAKRVGGSPDRADAVMQVLTGAILHEERQLHEHGDVRHGSYQYQIGEDW